MNPLFYPIIVPILLGILCFAVPRKVRAIREFLAVSGSAVTFGIIIWIFTQKPPGWSFKDAIILRMDDLSGFILLASGLFGFLIALYSIKFMKDKEKLNTYYGSLLLTIGAACGVLLSNHLIILLVFWGFLGITLYLLVQTGGDGSGAAAKKTLIIIGGTDALLLLGIGFIYAYKLGTDPSLGIFLKDFWTLPAISTFAADKIPLNDTLNILAFIFLALCAFAKAGAMPLHTWIPDVAEKAPITVTAYLPAALDKLLGIYLLGRICLHMFTLTNTMNLFLMIVGAVTIIAGVMMALIQHDLRRLLAYHAVSQVGYMVLGIGTGTTIGIAGGIFHMLNHSIYKACLFLTGGAVQHRTGSTDLDKLGGLGKLMPFTFISFLIAAFAISGIPPFNGFVSKWMVYQGLVELGTKSDSLYHNSHIVFLVAAMFGSGLTLASFMKLTHTVFLGVPSKAITAKKIKEVGFGMVVPMVVLALLCVIFGIFAYSIPVDKFLKPIFSDLPNLKFWEAGASDLPLYQGLWNPGIATILILLGLGVGLIIYLVGNIKVVREERSFIGGEQLPVEKRVTGTGFYNTIRDMGVIRQIYGWAEAKWFDIYDQAGRLAFGIANTLRKFHTGVLTSYILWVLMGLVVLFIVLMGK
jgi:formate hydrogenlyase subunit 3/multisubunit Na+/H+ antiporter MnhD subunit